MRAGDESQDSRTDRNSLGIGDGNHAAGTCKRNEIEDDRNRPLSVDRLKNAHILSVTVDGMTELRSLALPTPACTKL